MVSFLLSNISFVEGNKITVMEIVCMIPCSSAQQQYLIFPEAENGILETCLLNTAFGMINKLFYLCPCYAVVR